MADIPYAVLNEVYRRPAPRPFLPATPGGQGSFSYSDTKVYGPRQLPQMYTAWLQWYDSVTGLPQVNPTTGELIRQPLGSKGLIIPGTGGSAKAPGRRYFGSRAIGFNPNGLVLIRLIKV